MTHQVPVPSTFSLARSLDFLAGFTPCQGDFVLAGDSFTGVFAVGDRAVAYTVRQVERALAIETDDAAVIPMIAAMLGTGDQLAGFYQRAAGDVAAYRALVRDLRGLHHVRFRTLEEVAVHAVLAQHTPIALAGAQKRRVAAALGPSVEVAGRRLHAFPTFATIVPLAADDWQAILGHRAKAARLPIVVRAVAELGAGWLRTAPYADARAALEAIDGIGPFSSAMILLRGLGRMDDVPLETPGIAKVATDVYGPSWNPARIRARYGSDLGYWSFYLKAGHGRAERARRSLAS
jgi:DNA-3-methyladenine glycosylase II